MNGRKLTKAQIKKIERIDKLFASLKKENVQAMIYESGGCPALTFWRDADLDVDALFDNFHTNEFYTAQTQIDMLVP